MGRDACFIFLCCCACSCSCSAQVERQVVYVYWTEWAEISIEDSPSPGVMQISCIARFFWSLLCSTRKSTSDSTIFTLIALLPIAKTCLRGYSWALNCPRSKIGQKFLVLWCKKQGPSSLVFNSRAFYAHVRLVFCCILRCNSVAPTLSRKLKWFSFPSSDCDQAVSVNWGRTTNRPAVSRRNLHFTQRILKIAMRGLKLKSSSLLLVCALNTFHKNKSVSSYPSTTSFLA